jgi:sterol 3beta-glucosyltransferase
MKAIILTHGTRGDVQPYVALAKALREAGHEAVLGAPASAAALAEPHGVPFAPVIDEMNAFVDQPRVRRAMETGFSGLSGKRIALELTLASRPAMARFLAEMADVAADGGDVVVHMPGVPVHHIAEKMGIPAVPGALQPGWVPTGAFPNPMLPFTPPRTFNRASYATAQAFVRFMARSGDGLRADLGLPRRRGSRDILRRPDGGPATVLQGFSRHLLPVADPGYPSTVHTTGFWFLSAPPEWRPPADLEEFLAAGGPPVYIGFGSMVGLDPRKVGRIVTEAVRRAGVRAILAGAGAASASTGTVRTSTFWSRPRTTGCSPARPPSSTTAAAAPPAPRSPRAAPRSSARFWPTSPSGPPGPTRPGWRHPRSGDATCPPRGSPKPFAGPSPTRR